MNRAERRRRNKEMLKANNLNVIEAQEMAAHIAVDAIARLHYSLMMTIMPDWGKLQKKATRIEMMLELMEAYNERIVSEKLGDEEKAVCKAMDKLIVERGKNVKKPS